MAIQGLRTTDNFVTDQRPKNWREGILLLYPNGDMPLTALTSMMKKRTVDDPEFNWWDKNLDDRRMALGESLTAANTTITLATTANAKSLKEGDLLYVEHTGEIVAITSDPAIDTEIQIQRGYAGTTASAFTYTAAGINPNLLVIGSAYEEGSLAPTGIAYDPTKRYNYTQIFRKTLEVTRTASKTRLRTGDAVREAKRECLEYFGIDLERAMILGRRVETTKNGKPLRTMGGAESFIDSGNIKVATTDYATGVKFEHLEEYMYEIFKYGSSEKLAFAGNRALLTIQQIARNAKGVSWNIQSGIKEFGMNVTRIISPFGELVLKTHPLFNQVTGGTTGTGDYYGMESWLMILDMANFTYVHLKDSDIKYEPVLQANGLDGQKSGYIGETSIEVHHPLSHYLIKNLVTFLAE